MLDSPKRGDASPVHRARTSDANGKPWHSALLSGAQRIRGALSDTLFNWPNDLTAILVACLGSNNRRALLLGTVHKASIWIRARRGRRRGSPWYKLSIVNSPLQV